MILFLVVLLFGALYSPLSSVSAQGGLVVFINSNTTWTKADSPYDLTGPTVINQGVTLTINGGVTVNCNGYTLLINGTLKAVGDTSDNIRLNGDNITFGESASSSSVLENVVCNASITSSQPLTLNNNVLRNTVAVGDSSSITNNNVFGNMSAGNSATFSNNVITGNIIVGNSTAFMGNNIVGDITAGTSTTFSNNYINGTKLLLGGIMGHYYATALTVGNSSIISNNAISGGVVASSSTIFNNTITGGGPFTDWVGRPEDSSSAVQVSGTSSVTSNVIYSTTGGYGILIQGGPTTVSDNYVKNMIRVAGNATIDGNFVTSGGIQVGDIYINAFNEIDYGYGKALIENNIINGSSYGIGSSYVGGTATIQNNLLMNDTYGISLVSQANIQNNTMTTTSVAISLTNTAPTINYNNIVDYTQNSVLLTNNPLNIDATHNWWGINDIQAINLTIYDFKYDLSLGTVNFVPILNAQNDQAPSTTYTLQLPSPPSLPNQSPNPSNPIQTSTPSPPPSNAQTPAPGNSSTSSPAPSTTPTIPEYPPLVFAIVFLAIITLAAIIVRVKKRKILIQQ